MRLSTLITQQIGVSTMARQEARVVETMQQLASGKRVLSPADDPLAASQAVNIAQTQGLNIRYGENRDVARQNLNTQEQSLSSIATALGQVSTRLVEAGGVYSDADRASVAVVLSELRETLLGYANATDGNGQYLYSGSKGGTTPFVADASGKIVYQGDDGERLVQVAQTRQMPSADNGASIFMSAAPGSQVHFAQADNANQGLVVFGPVNVVDPSGPAVGASIQLTFRENPNFDASDANSSAWLIEANDISQGLPGTPVNGVDGSLYKSGGLIDLGGVTLTLSGEPVAGDSFKVESVANGDMDLFTMLDQVILALKEPTQNDPVKAVALQNVVNLAMRKISSHTDTVLSVRAEVGARLNELEALDFEADNRNINYRAQLSALEDLDYRAASSDLSVRMMALQAAELAYTKTQGLGLFNRNR